MLVAANPEFAEDIITKLRREKIEASVIGEFLKNPKMRIIVHKDKREKNSSPRMRPFMVSVKEAQLAK